MSGVPPGSGTRRNLSLNKASGEHPESRGFSRLSPSQGVSGFPGRDLRSLGTWEATGNSRQAVGEERREGVTLPL